MIIIIVIIVIIPSHVNDTQDVDGCRLYNFFIFQKNGKQGGFALDLTIDFFSVHVTDVVFFAKCFSFWSSCHFGL